MKQGLAVVFAAIVGWSAPGLAMQPDSGWYWNPTESGRGFNIEIQNNLMFLAGFVYDSSGNQMWITSGGAMSTDRSYVGDAYVTAGGQCVGCSYVSPSLTKIGTINVTFTNESTATVLLNGSQITVQRQQFGVDMTNHATPLLGEWATTEGSALLPIYFGERISFNGTRTDSAGIYATGSLTGDRVRVAVGEFDTNTGKWAILLDSSTSYYTFYVFRFAGLNRIEGNASTFRKGTSPSGALPFIGSRIRSAAAAAGQPAPGTDTKRAAGMKDVIALVRAQSGGEIRVDQAMVAVAARLEQALIRR